MSTPVAKDETKVLHSCVSFLKSTYLPGRARSVYSPNKPCFETHFLWETKITRQAFKTWWHDELFCVSQKEYVDKQISVSFFFGGGGGVFQNSFSCGQVHSISEYTFFKTIQWLIVIVVQLIKFLSINI